MARIVITKQVDAPVQSVFDVFTDIEKAADRISGIRRIEKITEGPVGKGTRFRETRIMFKKEATEELEITDFDPGRHYAVGCEACGCRFETVFRFQPDGRGAKVEMEMNSRPVTLFAKLMSPLSALMMGSMKKAMEKDMDELKAAAESAA